MRIGTSGVTAAICFMICFFAADWLVFPNSKSSCYAAISHPHPQSIETKMNLELNSESDGSTTTEHPFPAKSTVTLSLRSLSFRARNGTFKNITSLKRRRRSVVQLAGMLRCVTGCNPLSYKGYGCYCGYMGAGFPVDDIDRCCATHDWCYSHISCPQLLIYFVPYQWNCMAPGYPQCAEIGQAGGLPAECALQLCECDRAFARCIRKFPCPKNKAGCRKKNYSNSMTANMNNMFRG